MSALTVSHGRRWAIALATALSLAGCVESSEPLLTGAQPVWGQGARFQLYSMSDEGVKEPEIINLRWDGTAYRPAGKRNDTRGLTVHPFEGRTVIIQSQSSRAGAKYEYALARRIADGVYLVNVIDEQDADDAARTRFCRGGGQYSCRVINEEGLFALARATASKNHDRGGLALMLADPPKSPQTPPQKSRPKR